MIETMTIERLSTMLEAYGGDPLRWPELERAAALGLIGRDPAAARMQDEAQALDVVLDCAPASLPDATLAARILAVRPRPSIGARVRDLWAELFPQSPSWAPALGLVAALALGTGVQAAAAGRLGLDDLGEVAASDDADADIAPLSGGVTIAEEDVL